MFSIWGELGIWKILTRHTMQFQKSGRVKILPISSIQILLLNWMLWKRRKKKERKMDSIILTDWTTIQVNIKIRGSGDPGRDMYFSLDDMEIHEMAKRIRKKRKINKIEARLEDKTCGRSKLVRKNKVRFYKNFIFRPKPRMNSFYWYFRRHWKKRWQNWVSANTFEKALDITKKLVTVDGK